MKDTRDIVLITGASGKFGKELASCLHRQYQIIAIDRRPFPYRPKDIELFQIDIRRKPCEDIFRRNRISAVVHLGIVHDPRADTEFDATFNIIGTQKLLTYCQKYGVKKVVILTSASIYGPRYDNSQFLKEDSPLMAAGRFPQTRSMIAVDMYANSFFWKHPEIETVILRPVHIIGKVNNAPSNYLRLRRIPYILGYDPLVQIIHTSDLVQAICSALKPGIRGVFNIVGPEAIPLSVILRETGRPLIPLPRFLFKSVVKQLWDWKLTTFPPQEIDFIRFICLVDGTLAEQVLQFHPKKGMKETIASLRKGGD